MSSASTTKVEIPASESSTDSFTEVSLAPSDDDDAPPISKPAPSKCTRSKIACAINLVAMLIAFATLAVYFGAFYRDYGAVERVRARALHYWVQPGTLNEDAVSVRDSMGLGMVQYAMLNDALSEIRAEFDSRNPFFPSHDDFVRKYRANLERMLRDRLGNSIPSGFRFEYSERNPMALTARQTEQFKEDIVATFKAHYW